MLTTAKKTLYRLGSCLPAVLWQPSQCLAMPVRGFESQETPLAKAALEEQRLSADQKCSVEGEASCLRLDPALWSGRPVVVAQVTGSSDIEATPPVSGRLVGEDK